MTADILMDAKHQTFMVCITGCVRNQYDLGPPVQYSTILHWDYIFFLIMLFSCELFSPAVSIQQFSPSTLLGEKKKKRERNKNKFSLGWLNIQNKFVSETFVEKKKLLYWKPGWWSMRKPSSKTSRLSVVPVCKNTLASTSSAQPYPGRWKLQLIAKQL